MHIKLWHEEWLEGDRIPPRPLTPDDYFYWA